MVAGLPDQEGAVIWDGGAEGTTISSVCASRILFAQQELPEGHRIGLVGLCRQPCQNFNGFLVSDTSVPVTVRAQLYLVDPVTKSELPPITVKIVRGQKDDVLIAGPHLDALGWYPTKNSFVLSSCDISLSRKGETQYPCRPESELKKQYADQIARSRELERKRRQEYFAQLRRSRVMSREQASESNSSSGNKEPLISGGSYGTAPKGTTAEGSDSEDCRINRTWTDGSPEHEICQVPTKNKNCKVVIPIVAQNAGPDVDEQTLNNGLGLERAESPSEKSQDAGVCSNPKASGQSEPPEGPHLRVARTFVIVPFPKSQFLRATMLFGLVYILLSAHELQLKATSRPETLGHQSTEFLRQGNVNNCVSSNDRRTLFEKTLQRVSSSDRRTLFETTNKRVSSSDHRTLFECVNNFDSGSDHEKPSIEGGETLTLVVWPRGEIWPRGEAEISNSLLQQKIFSGERGVLRERDTRFPENHNTQLCEYRNFKNAEFQEAEGSDIQETGLSEFRESERAVPVFKNLEFQGAEGSDIQETGLSEFRDSERAVRLSKKRAFQEAEGSDVQETGFSEFRGFERAGLGSESKKQFGLLVHPWVVFPQTLMAGWLGGQLCSERGMRAPAECFENLQRVGCFKQVVLPPEQTLRVGWIAGLRAVITVSHAQWHTWRNKTGSTPSSGLRSVVNRFQGRVGPRYGMIFGHTGHLERAIILW